MTHSTLFELGMLYQLAASCLNSMKKGEIPLILKTFSDIHIFFNNCAFKVDVTNV